ncbi:MAG: hypothetical protein F6K00_08095 [Leptolyngbya sp. SIOISBB]|nr:hypothetical protein [Leptolyngbya sp. SIOISBB]
MPFQQVSLEMLYRGLYHFTVAHHKGLTDHPVNYFAAPENQDLGVIKRLRKRRQIEFVSVSEADLTFEPWA